MADAGEIKAKVTIEYDGSGVEKAKEDLASLAESAGGMGGSMEGAGESLASFGDQAVKSAGGAKTFSEALESLPKVVESGGSAISSATEALDEHRQAVEDTVAAYENLQEPVAQVTKHTQSMNEAWGEAGRNFQVFQEAYNSVDSAGMYDAASSMQIVYDHLDKTGQSIEQFSSSLGKNNAQLFHEMSTDWAQMNASIDTTGAKFASVGKSANEGFGAIASGAADADKAVSEFLGTTSKSAKAMEPVSFTGAFGEAFSSVTGFLSDIAMPLMAVQMIGMAVQQAGQAIYDSAVIAEGPAAHSFGTFTGTVDALGQSAQKVGAQFSESFGQQLLPTLNALNYQASTGDLGGIGGFVGGIASTIANLTEITTLTNIPGGFEGLANQGAQLFGLPQPYQGPGPEQQSQIQYQQQMAQMPQTVQANAQQLQYQSSLVLAQAVDPNWEAAQNRMTASQRAAQYLMQDYEIRHPQSQYDLIQQARYDAYATKQEQNYQAQMAGGGYGPVDIPGYWGLGGVGSSIGNFLNSPMGTLMFGALNPGGTISNIGDIFGKGGLGGLADWAIGLKDFSPIASLFGGGGGALGSIGDFFKNFSFSIPLGSSDFWENLFGGGASVPATTGTGTCFPAGTRILMRDRSTRPIENLNIGEQVLAHDGTKQVYTTVLARIVPLPRRVYTLAFSDGNTLTLTISHPIATTQGWKSLSPEATKLENPDLAVTMLEPGDTVMTVRGTSQLLSISRGAIVQIYNITVDDSHTFYADGVLVHNKVLSHMASQQIGQQTADQIGEIQLPHIDLSGITAGLATAFSGISLPSIPNLGGEINGALSSMFGGISLPAVPDIGGELSGALSGMLGGISLPAIPDIGGMLSGALSGALGGISLPAIPDIGGEISGALSGAFGGISLPAVPDIGGMLNGALTGAFGGISLPAVPDIGGMIDGAMSGMFDGISVPTAPNLGAMINGAMSGMFAGISLPSIPGFASGVEGFGGGLAVVGEAGPELVHLPSGSSVYPMAAGAGSGGGSSPISLGGGGGNMPQSINVSVHLDSQAIISAIGLPLSQNIRLTSGMRAF